MRLNPNAIVSATDLVETLKTKTKEFSVDTSVQSLIDDLDTIAGDFLGLAENLSGETVHLQTELDEFKQLFNDLRETSRLIYDAITIQ